MSLNFRPLLKHLLTDDWMTHVHERFPPDQSATFADKHLRPVKEHATRLPAMTPRMSWKRVMKAILYLDGPLGRR